MIKLVCHSIHFQSRAQEFISEDSFHKVIPGEVAIAVLVQFPEQIRNPGFLVIVMFQETFSPIVPIEVLDLLQFVEIVQFFFKATVAFPSHHPYMTPFLPKCLGSWVSVVLWLADAGTAGNNSFLLN